ncbi:hypothetical protein KFL_000360180 [Klebsormidium nitens]|uniref:Uncharacterized protein n=1 Tax=Klebsormidium nitens TaxID=105231 RepID=A0A1Y1HPK4_KLENI|nr:hypothetical protein KFL_000360180 [Klebsormidium nitens]|eukprot:GAQ79702.1 hypothetical protein KFL_000360180 [Klebsormidium nitens]
MDKGGKRSGKPNERNGTEGNGTERGAVRKQQELEQRKAEEIARLQRVGAQPAFSGEGVRGSDSGAGKTTGMHTGSPFLKPHEEMDELARGELDVAEGLEERGAGGSGVWRDLMLHPTPVVKRMLLIGLGSNFFQQATGVDAIV